MNKFPENPVIAASVLQSYQLFLSIGGGFICHAIQLWRLGYTYDVVENCVYRNDREN